MYLLQRKMAALFKKARVMITAFLLKLGLQKELDGSKQGCEFGCFFFGWGSDLRIYQKTYCILGGSTKFLCREISRNIYFVFREIIFFISRNFAKFREISYREILRNFAKYREIFVTKLKFSQGKIHC
jgi:hypothetical protein